MQGLAIRGIMLILVPSPPGPKKSKKFPPNLLIRKESISLKITPIMPPNNPIMADSNKNSLFISLKEAPITFITPISLVLSYILITIVLVIPMAATNKDTAPMPPRTACIMPAVFFHFI